MRQKLNLVHLYLFRPRPQLRDAAKEVRPAGDPPTQRRSLGDRHNSKKENGRVDGASLSEVFDGGGGGWQMDDSLTR